MCNIHFLIFGQRDIKGPGPGQVLGACSTARGHQLTGRTERTRPSFKGSALPRWQESCETPSVGEKLQSPSNSQLDATVRSLENGSTFLRASCHSEGWRFFAKLQSCGVETACLGPAVVDRGIDVPWHAPHKSVAIQLSQEISLNGQTCAWPGTQLVGRSERGSRLGYKRSNSISQNKWTYLRSKSSIFDKSFYCRIDTC